MALKDVARLLAAADFAARKHRTQRRKDPEATPYINHPLAVAEILARVANVTDLLTLQGALLHDTLEDTETTPEELELQFGPEVRHLVLEISDDKTLPKEERKRLQIVHAPELSKPARLIKLADKIANLNDISPTCPAAWTAERKRDYLDWAEAVVNQMRGSNHALETLFDSTLSVKRALFSSSLEAA